VQEAAFIAERLYDEILPMEKQLFATL